MNTRIERNHYRRLYVEKKQDHESEAPELLSALREQLGVSGIETLRIFRRYDFPDPGNDRLSVLRDQVFSDPATDIVWEDSPPAGNYKAVAVEYLPGQYDARADAASQLIGVLLDGDRVAVRCGRLYLLYGDIGEDSLRVIKKYLINPVDSREVSPTRKPAPEEEHPKPSPIPVIKGFSVMGSRELEALRQELGLAMFREDIELCGNYFGEVARRDPSLAELKILDTYWSDHCRHTTFNTVIKELKFPEGRIGDHLRETYSMFRSVHGEGPLTLMDLALGGMRILRLRGKLEELEESEEVNACSVRIPVSTPAGEDTWLLMFKNETHNHPTEIEPYGGAATCLGGAIRDPLSGRAYVYQAMRLTGSSDPRKSYRETREGKLPQRVITTEAAHGYSSYGNQVGIATGYVHELYHPGFEAKRMEIGAVIGAVPEAQVRRESPLPGDVVLLIGGATGRDGIGGATGSSKEHDSGSLESASAEVQKGNPLEERALQRFFREKEVASRIKRSNDFGAGGVSVAVGELADGLDIDLDTIPVKYAGLNGLELALSESQERMAVVVATEDAGFLISRAEKQNLQAVTVARVTEESRLRMTRRGEVIADIERGFLDSSGAPRFARGVIEAPAGKSPFSGAEYPAGRRAAEDYTEGVRATDEHPAGVYGFDPRREWLLLLGELNNSGQTGLVERFDSTIGARTVLLPFGGHQQLSPAEGMAAKLPVSDGMTRTVSIMSAGYDPWISEWSPYHGGIYAVVEAVGRAVACGASPDKMYLTLQEYFERMSEKPEKWGKPAAALLGALRAQLDLEIAAIGGKDSMSGSFEELNVPPTLAAFAVGPSQLDMVISPEFKAPDHRIVLFQIPLDNEGLIELPLFRGLSCYIRDLIGDGVILSCRSLRNGGIPAALSEMCFGNGIGVALNGGTDLMEPEGWWKFARPWYGSYIVELRTGITEEDLPNVPEGVVVGTIGFTHEVPEILFNGLSLGLDELLKAWRSPLEEIFPSSYPDSEGKDPAPPMCTPRRRHKLTSAPLSRQGISTPLVCMPVFPGTNCEEESSLRFREAGGRVRQVIFRWKNADGMKDSIGEIADAIRVSQILMLPGGFSAGDEPDGSAKYIAAVLRSSAIRDAVTELLEERDGLVLGICNGFQALVRTGLLPFGEYRSPSSEMPTLGVNRIGRHVSRYVKTVTVSTASPWLSGLRKGDLHMVAVSHGEGRFSASPEVLRGLGEKGQIVFQYCDREGRATMEYPENPNGSLGAVEGLISPDGRILGKMGHSERIGEGVAKNIPGEKDQRLFESAVRYFTGEEERV